MIKNLMFDFDGTIADTVTAAHRVFNQLAPLYKYQPVAEGDVEHMRSMSLRDFLRHQSISAWRVAPLTLRARRELKAHLAEVGMRPGLKEALQDIAKSGKYEMGILTSNSQENVQHFLEHNDMEDLFGFIHTSLYAWKKDRRVKKLMKVNGWLPEQSCYIGDTSVDVDAGRKSGVTTIAVSWGFNTHDMLSKVNPDYLLDKPEQLLEVFPV